MEKLTQKQKKEINKAISRAAKAEFLKSMIVGNYGGYLADTTFAPISNFERSSKQRQEQTNNFKKNHDWKHDKYFQEQMKRSSNDILKNGLTGSPAGSSYSKRTNEWKEYNGHMHPVKHFFKKLF